MNVSQLREVFRSRLDDVNEPYLVSDTLFLSYLNEAQDEACIRSNLLFDKISDFCTVAVTSGTAVYALDPTIYAIKYAYLIDSAGNRTTLSIATAEELDRLYSDWRELTDTPKWLIQHDSSVELACSPNANFTLKLEVYRFPLVSLAVDSDSPEINRFHHNALLFWVLHRSYSNPDADLINIDEALGNEREFIKVFGQRPTATQRKAQYRNTPHRNTLSFI